MKKCNRLLVLDDIIEAFGGNSEEIDMLLHNFVKTHNSSIYEKSGTTYEIIDIENNSIGFFVLNLGTINRTSKNSLFFKQNRLTHDWYPIINLEFLIRKPGKKYEGTGEYIFESIQKIINYLEEKINIKYIYVNSIRSRISYFEKKGFIAINEKARKSGKENIDMLFEI